MREVKYDSSVSCFPHLTTHSALWLTLEARAIAEGKPLTQNICRGRDPALYLLLASVVENW